MTAFLVFSLLFLNGCHVVIHAAIPIISKPKVTKIHYYKEKDSVNLPCQASTYQGSVHYEWLRNGKSVISKTNTQTGQQISYSRLNGSLIITNFDEDYNGDYNCVASSEDASSMSQTQTLIQVKYSDIDNREPKVYQRDEYTYFQIPFDNHGEIVSETIVYKWYAKNDLMHIGMDGGRRFIDKKGNLHFTFLKRDEDEQRDKGYICGYTANLLKKHIKIGPVNTLTVTEKDAQDIKPALEYSSRDNTGQMGSEAKLECFFSGYDMKTTDHLPTIKWFDNENEIRNNNKFKLSRDNRILTIKKLEEKDEKYFFCQGFITNGRTQKNKVFLNVTSIPIWVKAPQSITNPIGHEAVFNCETRSAIREIDPAPPVWYINAKKVQNYYDYPQFTFSDDKKTLSVKVRTLNDTNCFQCMVSNSIGTLMGEACLKAVLPIVISVQPPGEQLIKRGEIVDLTVKATADRQSDNPLTYEWTFNNETYTIGIKTPPFVTYNPMLGITFINTSKAELKERDYEKIGGLYTCRIFNQFDSKTIETYVVLKDVVPAAATASADFDMWIIGVIIGIIFLTIVIIIIIFVISRKQQEGDYNVDKKETDAGLDPEKELLEKGFNDFSRGDNEDIDSPERVTAGNLEFGTVPIGDDESLVEYTVEENTHFKEDGSFIGIYQDKSGNKGKDDSKV